MSSDDDSRNGGLQVARAFAALVVAYFHSYIALRAFPETAQIPIEPLRQWGFLGANFFFAISGYVICLVAAKSSFSPRAFAIKRVFRLYPIYWIAMAAVVVLIALGKYRVEPIGHFLYSMTLLPQLGAPAYDFSWTLEREMVFYALAAVTVPLAGIPALALTLAVLAAAGWYFGNPWTFHLVSTVQADFLAGVLVFLLRGWIARLGVVAPILGGLILLAYTRSHDFPFSVPLASACILVGMVNWRIDRNGVFGRALIAIGDASYSIYLLHYLVFIVTVNIAVRLGLPAWACEPWRAFSLVACCLVSFVTWKLIEQPMIRLGNRLAASSSKTSVSHPAQA